VLQLPIEVLGSGAPDAPAIGSTTLTLAGDASTVQTLYVQCHRCGFYDAPEFEALAKPLVKTKASLRVVGGADAMNNNVPWIDITNSTVQVDPVALAHGGINGGLVTLSFTLAIDAATRSRLVAAPGTNRIEFRFNGTDGNSNGFRVLDVQLQNAAGQNLTPATKNWADIAQEKLAGRTPSAVQQESADQIADCPAENPGRLQRLPRDRRSRSAVLQLLEQLDRAAFDVPRTDGRPRAGHCRLFAGLAVLKSTARGGSNALEPTFPAGSRSRQQAGGGMVSGCRTCSRSA
jgi:hypothetical protein